MDTTRRAYGQDVARGTALRHDHGSQYMSHEFQEELAFLGIASSPAFVAEPECNGVAERWVKRLKEQLLWTRVFDTVEELRVALHAFQELHNEAWLVQKHDYRTPSAMRAHLVGAQAEAA